MLQKLHLEFISTEKLLPHAKNPKLHPQKQVRQIANSIRQFGFITPIVTDSKNVIIVGHGRLLAAKLLGLKEVPVISIEHLLLHARSYEIAINPHHARLRTLPFPAL